MEHPVLLYEDAQFRLFRLITGEKWKENCYLIADNPTKEAVVIDPGYDSGEMIDLICRSRYRLSHILFTHAHHDHIAGAEEISDYFSVDCVVHPDDKRVLMHTGTYGLRFAGRKAIRPKRVRWLDKETLCRLSERGIEILHTPGHSKGSLCFFYKQFVFSGDTLIKHGIGRTDLPEGDKASIIDSIHSLMELCRIKQSQVLYPGHGMSWSAEEAKRWWDSQDVRQVSEHKKF